MGRIGRSILSGFRRCVHRFLVWAWHEDEDTVRQRVKDQQARIEDRERERVEVGANSRRDAPITAEQWDKWMNL